MEAEAHRKNKALEEKTIIVNNMEREIEDLSQKIERQKTELSRKNRKKKTIENIDIPSLPNNPIRKLPPFSQELQNGTPKVLSDMVGDKFKRFRPLAPSQVQHSQTQSAAQPRHTRTFTEGSEESRLELSLRKKKIYT